LDAISLERLSLVHPLLSARVQNLASQLDFTIRVTMGISTVAQQNALWQIGRDAEGNVIGRVVTHAKGTESNHVLGLACDIVPMDLPDGSPDWNSTSASWRRIVALAPSCGLRDGICFKDGPDEPHLELVEVPEVPTGEMQNIYLQAGVEAVWSELGLTG
jgi:hypothetical protein